MYPWQNFILGLCEHLAWPFLLGGCIVYYRKDIRKLLARITKLPLGAELNPETVEEQQENKLNYDELVVKKAEETAKQKRLKTPKKEEKK